MAGNGEWLASTAGSLSDSSRTEVSTREQRYQKVARLTRVLPIPERKTIVNAKDRSKARVHAVVGLPLIDPARYDYVTLHMSHHALPASPQAQHKSIHA